MPPVGIKVSRFEGWPDYTRDLRKKVEINLSGKSGSDGIAGIGLLEPARCKRTRA